MARAHPVLRPPWGLQMRSWSPEFTKISHKHCHQNHRTINELSSHHSQPRPGQPRAHALKVIMRQSLPVHKWVFRGQTARCNIFWMLIRPAKRRLLSAAPAPWTRRPYFSRPSWNPLNTAWLRFEQSSFLKISDAFFST